MTKSAALEYIKSGIRINCICPATVGTPMVAAQWPEWQAKTNAGHGIGRVAKAEEVAAAAYFLVDGGCDSMVGAAMELGGGAGAV